MTAARERWSPPKAKHGEILRPSRQALKSMERENALYPANQFVDVPRVLWPSDYAPNLMRALRSRDFMVQVYGEKDGVIRLSIHRCAFDRDAGRWRDGISWDDLQHIKTLCGFGDCPAVEIYPPLADEVNVANIRHLFVLPEAPSFMWTKRRKSENV
jgi:hypothetical protein